MFQGCISLLGAALLLVSGALQLSADHRLLHDTVAAASDGCACDASTVAVQTSPDRRQAGFPRLQAFAATAPALLLTPALPQPLDSVAPPNPRRTPLYLYKHALLC